MAAAGKSSADKLARELEQRYGLADIADDEALEPAATVTDDVKPPLPKSRGSDQRGSERRRSDISYAHAVPAPPFWGARVLEKIAIKAALGYMNEVMLFQVQWGFRKRGRSKDEFKQYIDREVRPIYRDLVARCEREEILQPQAVYGYWPANSDGDDLIIYAPPEHDCPGGAPIGHAGSAPHSSGLKTAQLRELLRFTFPRQRKAPHWCLSDFWRPAGGGLADVAAFQIVTAGRRVSDVARQWFAGNEYQQYLYLHGLGVETAEALAEFLHKQIRMELGVAGHDEREIGKLFQQGYQGSRYSFGYPACPNLEDHVKLWPILQPGRIGITLSEEFQLHPEQSTSAIIAHHPQARYFNVRRLTESVSAQP